MTRHRLVVAGLSTALAATSAVAWFGLTKTPASAQGSSSSAPPAPAVVATGGTAGNVVAYPTGVIAIVNSGLLYKPEGTAANAPHRTSERINVYRVNTGYAIDVPRVENLGNQSFDTETGALLNPTPQKQAPK